MDKIDKLLAYMGLSLLTGLWLASLGSIAYLLKTIAERW